MERFFNGNFVNRLLTRNDKPIILPESSRTRSSLIGFFSVSPSYLVGFLVLVSSTTSSSSSSSWTSLSNHFGKNSSSYASESKTSSSLYTTSNNGAIKEEVRSIEGSIYCKHTYGKDFSEVA